MITDELVRRVTDEPWTAQSVLYDSGSPATGGLTIISTPSRRYFVKQLRHVRHWPLLPMLPEQLRAEFVATFPWRAELDEWHDTFAGHLPKGLRVPQLYEVTELPDDRLLIWMEHIDALPDTAWTLDTFTRAAFVLGGLNALRSTPEILAFPGTAPNSGMRKLYESRVRHGVQPMLENDDAWRHPLLDAALRPGLQRVAALIPGILERLDTLPLTLPHGDASPQNLLIARDAPEEFVAIDISFQAPAAIGFDLAQLLVGLAHAGCLPLEALPAIHPAIISAFLEGLRVYGFEADESAVKAGYLGALAIRSALVSIPFEQLGAPVTEELAAHFARRAELTHLLCDLVLSESGVLLPQ